MEHGVNSNVERDSITNPGKEMETESLHNNFMNGTEKNHSENLKIDNTTNISQVFAEKDVMKLYIKLYCNEKGGTKSKHITLLEAKKSWHSLSKIEKLKFYNKYTESQIKWKEKIVNCIDKAEPYMKKIAISVVSEEDDINPDISLNGHHDKDKDIIETRQTQESDCKEDVSVDEANMLDNGSYQNFQECLHETKKEQDDDIPEVGGPWMSEKADKVQIPLVEPKPPITGKELYELLNLSRGGRDEDTWKSLSSTEKSRYNRAVLTLKKNYIINLKLFLESLTSRALFEYYHKVL